MDSGDSWFGVMPSFAVIPEVCLLSSGNSLRWRGEVCVCECRSSLTTEEELFSSKISNYNFFPTKKEVMDLVWGDVSTSFSSKRKSFYDTSGIYDCKKEQLGL